MPGTVSGSARWRMAAATGLAITSVTMWAAPERALYWYLGAQLAGLWLGLVLSHLPGLLRLAIAPRELAEEVHQPALQAFHDHGLAETRDRTGTLILVSLLERRVEILADRGIHARVPEGTWDDLVAGLVARVRAGRLAEGLVEAVARCGEILAEHLPPRPDDENELDDGVVVE